MLNPEKIRHEHLTDLSISPVRYRHFTFGSPKKVVFHILQIINVVPEKNK